jgi:tRNA threonylcarbamoyladenosine biosynthesis protein TsaE
MAAESDRRTLRRRFLSRSPRATEELGRALGEKLRAGSVVILDGELGSGKTCFVRGLARGLGVVERVQSPTYALMHTYPGRLELFHFDAWMEGRERAFLLDGGLEWMQAGGVSVVEWGSRVSECLPRPLLALAFEHKGPSEREIAIDVVEQSGSERSSEGRALLEVVTELALPAGIEESAA